MIPLFEYKISPNFNNQPTKKTLILQNQEFRLCNIICWYIPKKKSPFFCSTFLGPSNICNISNQRSKAPEKLHPSGVQDHCVPNIDNEKVREKHSVEVNSKGCSWCLPGRMGKKRWNPLGIFPLQMGVMSVKIWGVGMGRE